MPNMLEEMQVFNVVKVRFRDSGGKTYSYKTTGTHEVDDEVLVYTPSGKTKVVDVVGFTPYNDLTDIEGVKYKWIVGPVDLTEYHYQVEQEEKLLARMHKLKDKTQAKLKRDALRKAVFPEDANEAKSILEAIGSWG